MSKKSINKNSYYLLEQYDDESECVNWIYQQEISNEYNCGCCNECLCDDNVKCSNCGCFCNDNSEEENSETENNGIVNLNNFDIKIIKTNKEKKVRITLQLNILLSNKKTKIININLDINSKTYLKFAKKLY